MKKFSLALFITLWTCQFIVAQCNSDRHSAMHTDSWISCDMSENPNPERGVSHWIMYDFGDFYELNQSTIWNCNGFENTEAGIRNYVVDYSNDGLSWNEVGEYELAQAAASTFYEGEDGPNFDGLAARYILITSLGSYASSCACLSEIRFETSGTTVDVAEINKLNIGLTLAPNPASDNVSLQVTDSENAFDAEISVLDQTGRLISKVDYKITKGDSNIELSTVDLHSGNYLVKIQSAEGIVTRKLIIIQDHK